MNSVGRNIDLIHGGWKTTAVSLGKEWKIYWKVKNKISDDLIPSSLITGSFICRFHAGIFFLQTMKQLPSYKNPHPQIKGSLSSNIFVWISSLLMADDQLGVDMWRNTHFVSECTVKTATADVSPCEKHALSQNSLSSSQSHALLMIRRERKTLKHSGSQCDGWQPVCVCLCVGMLDCIKLNGWIWIDPVRSMNQHRADHGYAAATGALARALPSHFDNSLWLAAIWSSPSEVYYLSCFVHNIVSHDAIISSLCWRNTGV